MEVLDRGPKNAGSLSELERLKRSPANASARNSPGDLKLVGKYSNLFRQVNGMYPLLDLITEQGSSGLGNIFISAIPTLMTF